MSNYSLSMWGSIVCSTVWAANDHLIFMTVWMVLAVLYGALAASEKVK